MGRRQGPGQSTCRVCGEVIWWHTTRNGKTFPPLVKTGKNVMLLVDGVMLSGAGWMPHVCSEETTQENSEEPTPELDLQARWWEAELATRREREKQLTERREWALSIGDLVPDDGAVFLRNAYRLAMHYQCPRCGAAVDASCENLSARMQGELKPTRLPHHERYELTPEDERPIRLSSTEIVIPYPKERPT